LVCWKPVWSRLKLQPTCLESSCLCRVFVYLVLVSGEPGDCGLGLSHWDVVSPCLRLTSLLDLAWVTLQHQLMWPQLFLLFEDPIAI
jgi:hypothetical protein